MNTSAKKFQVTLVAEDSIGRKESLTLKISENVYNKLKKASQSGDEEEAINEIYDGYKLDKGYLSKGQFYSLRDFLNLCHHKFYNYTITVK